LTLKIGSVKQTRSSAVLEFTRLAQSPGLKLDHGTGRKAGLEGQRGSNSEALVEANGNLLKAKWSPEALAGFPGWQ
jgi:hypothetical protein